MIPTEMVVTSLLLGLFVLLAGCYGICYGAGRLRGSRKLVVGAYLTYGAQVLVAVAIVMLTSLDGWWKLLVAASCAAYLRIPPITWRFLVKLHEPEGQHS